MKVVQTDYAFWQADLQLQNKTFKREYETMPVVFLILIS